MSSNGIAVGIVTALDDPDGLGRVRVSFPHLADTESYWARTVNLMAGKERGVCFRPEVDDEVLVAFEHGDLRRPYVLGGLWSTVDQPPADDGQPAQNNWRFFKSRSGHIVKLNDTNGSETIEIVDKTGSNSIVFDTAQNRITIAAQQSVRVEATDVEVTGQASVKVSAPQVEVKADGQMTLQAGGTLKIQGALVQIN